MNLGLGTLLELKTYLLPSATLVRDTQWDAVITAIGRGVAGRFEAVTSRKLGRVVGDTYLATGDTEVFVLPRLPIELITTLEWRESSADSWTAETTTIDNHNPHSGVVYLATRLTTHKGQVRFTYTGGYWFDEVETGGTAQPAGSTAVPADLKLAWQLQSAAVWSRRDILGEALKQAGGAAATIAGVDLVPEVAATLRTYTRFSL